MPPSPTTPFRFVLFATSVTAIGGFLLGYDTAVINSASSAFTSSVWVGLIAGRGGAQEIGFAPRAVRFVRVHCLQRCQTPAENSNPGYSLQVFE